MRSSIGRGSTVALFMAEVDDNLEWRTPEIVESALSRYDDAQLVRLREQEQLWLQWVSLLHDHHSKMGTEESRIVLEIAKKRWLQARRTLKLHLDGP